MITVFYKLYPYAPKATCLSVISSVLSIFSLIGGIACFYLLSGFIKYVLGVLLIALAVFLFVYCSRILPDKLAKKETEENITTKARYAFTYCREHPEAYGDLAAKNAAFAEKYMLNEAGKVVKRK